MIFKRLYCIFVAVCRHNFVPRQNTYKIRSIPKWILMILFICLYWIFVAVCRFNITLLQTGKVRTVPVGTYTRLAKHDQRGARQPPPPPPKKNSQKLLAICEYDHLNNNRCSILRVPLIFTNVQHMIYLNIYKFYNYIHGKYIWNRSVMLTNNACLWQERKVYAIMKNSVASTHCAFEGWSMFKVMKPSIWYLDENRLEAGQQQIVN